MSASGDAMHALRYKATFQVALFAAAFLSLVALTAWLPRRFPDVTMLTFLFGHRRYIVFWLVVALWLFLWFARPGRRHAL